MDLPNIPADYKKWLNERGISDEVLVKNNISVHRGDIVIPVYDPKGVFLFNKYRRNPWSEEGPKYRYDAGATSALYNAHQIVFPHTAVFICEGELDAMAMQSHGYQTVSTTGGAGTFKKEWADSLGKGRLFITYDNDGAGIQGALKLLGLLPNARVILIPPQNGVKDVTDFFKAHGEREFGRLLREAQEWAMPTTKDECRRTAVTFEDRRQHMLSNGQDTDFVQAALRQIASIYDSLKANERKREYRSVGDSKDALKNARAVPMNEFIKFNTKGDALCIAHDDTRPSLHWFKKDNRVKCFSCGFLGDTIDVVMKLENLKVGEAIKKING